MKVDVYWIPETKAGKLAIMPRPRGNDWLEDELRAWQRDGIDSIVSLLMPNEAFGLGLSAEKAICDQLDIKFEQYPIVDRNVPTSKRATVELAGRINQQLNNGDGVAIHCRMGMGRSASIVACVLLMQGMSPRNVFDAIAVARGVKVPDTPAQVEWVHALTGDLIQAAN